MTSQRSPKWLYAYMVSQDVIVKSARGLMCPETTVGLWDGLIFQCVQDQWKLFMGCLGP